MQKVGYKNPPKNRQFGQPDGNPQGATSAQRQMEIANAELATQIRNRMLEALAGQMNEHPEKEAIVEKLIKADILNLLKQAEDRGLGTPKQSIDLESPNGTMSPTRIVIEAAQLPDNDTSNN
jgi:hypothetical protein